MQADVIDVELGSLGAVLEHRADGVMLVRSTETLARYPDKLSERLEHWAERAPDRLFLAQRTKAGPWRDLTYGAALAQMRRIASALAARDLSVERPLAILSGNDIEHALISLAAMDLGIPVAPISPAYSLISSDFEKLRTILARLTPGLIFCADAALYDKAIAAACDPSIEIVATQGGPRPTTDFAALFDAPLSPALEGRRAAVGPDTIAKILFTSGSTGKPKGVINTQRMMCANQAMLTHWLQFASQEPPTLLDWLPWHHAFGGNHNFNFVLFTGGTLYIDDGKPTPAGIAETVRNLREISPSIYFNVPKAFEELVPRLENDDALAQNFFRRLRLLFYAGASLPPHVNDALAALGRRHAGQPVLMVTSLGSTETAPAALSCSKETARPGLVGVPLPSIELKLLEAGGKLEARLRGPIITPGYWRDPEQTAAAFDEEGFYRLGDALKFARPGDPNGGFIFDGRISEDFKLATGTWVSVGPMRIRLISALAPFARDAVIAGHDRDDVTALIFPEIPACRDFLGKAAESLSDAEVLANPHLRVAVEERLSALASHSTGSSTRFARVLLMAAPASIDANEITDKGSLNQRAVLERRADLVEALYAHPPGPAVISAR